MKSFCFCKTCRKLYPIFEPEAVSFIRQLPEGDEFSVFEKGTEEQLEFCARFHACEAFPVVYDFIIEGEEWDPFKTLGFLVLTSVGNRLVIKVRKSIEESARYEFFLERTSNTFPFALLSA